MAPTPYAIPVPPVVYVVDDDESMRELVVEIARSLHAVPRAYEPIECLVVDIRMPEMSGLDVQKSLLERGMLIPTLFITGYGDVGTAVEAMRAGALDYIQKPFAPEDLAVKIRAGLERSRARHLSSLEQDTINARFALLTVKEREVALRVVAGKSSREIADEFGLSVRTIENHRARIMDKLHADSVVELVHLLTTRVNASDR